MLTEQPKNWLCLYQIRENNGTLRCHERLLQNYGKRCKAVQPITSLKEFYELVAGAGVPSKDCLFYLSHMRFRYPRSFI